MFVTVCLGLIMVGISATSISVAFPVMSSSFQASTILSGWVLSIYQLVSIAAMPLAGKASDIFGRKPIFIGSLLLFSLGSVLCAIAPNIQTLIACRFLQGIGGGAYFPVATGIVADSFPQRRQQLIGLTSSIYPIGQIIGPNLGGWMVTTLGWRSVFWFNVPAGIAIVLLSVYFLKAGIKTKGSIDLRGAGLLTGAVLAILTGVSELGHFKTGASVAEWFLTGILFLTGFILLYVLISHISRAKDPIIDWVVLKGRPFLASNVYNFIAGTYYFGILSFVPLYAVKIFGMSTLKSGIVLTPWAVGVMISAGITSFFLLRWGYRKPLLVGNSLVIVGLFLLGMEPQALNLLGIHLDSTGLLIVLTFLVGVGVGTVFPAANNACIELMPEHVASITGVRTMFRNIGGTFIITIISLILNNASSLAQGFKISFFFICGLTILVFPAILNMPRGAQECVEVK